MRLDTIMGDDAVTITASDAQNHRVGRVSFRRVYGPRAVLTIAVEDAYWHRGLPERLVTALCVEAERQGISRLLVRTRASDVRQLALLRTEFGTRGLRNGAYVDAELATATVSRVRASAALCAPSPAAP